MVAMMLTIERQITMSKSEYQLLLWLAGTTSEKYWDKDARDMREGIDTTSERLFNTAIRLRDRGFMVRVLCVGARQYYIVRDEDRAAAIARSSKYKAQHGLL